MKIMLTASVLSLFVILTNCSVPDVKYKYSIGCGEKQSGYIGGQLWSINWASLEFVNTAPQNVLFTNCNSDFAHVLRLYDQSGDEIQRESTNGCNGFDCTDSSYNCSSQSSGGRRVTFTMSSLPTGTYELRVTQLNNYYGNWAVEVHCEPATPSPVSSSSESPDNGTVDICTVSFVLLCLAALYFLAVYFEKHFGQKEASEISECSDVANGNESQELVRCCKWKVVPVSAPVVSQQPRAPGQCVVRLDVGSS